MMRRFKGFCSRDVGNKSNLLQLPFGKPQKSSFLSGPGHYEGGGAKRVCHLESRGGGG